MLTLVKMVQYLIKALNSEGTPGQIAAGIAVGAALGLTPLVNLHNVLILAAVMLLNMSVPGALLGWLLFVPFGFALDPVFDSIGTMLLLDTPALTGLFATMYNTPLLALFNFNNTIVVGSLAGWMVLAFPIFFLARWGVARYRATIYLRIKDTRFMKAVQASKVYNVYRLFRP